MGMSALIYQRLNNPDLGKTNSNKLSSLDLNKYNLKNQIKTELKSGNTSDLVDLANKTDVDEAAKKFNELDKGDQNKLIGNLLNDAYDSLMEQLNKMKDLWSNQSRDEMIKNNIEDGTLYGAETENTEEGAPSGKDDQEVISLKKPSVEENIQDGTLYGVDTKETEEGAPLNKNDQEIASLKKPEETKADTTTGASTNNPVESQETTDFQTKHMRKFNFNNRAFSR